MKKEILSIPIYRCSPDQHYNDMEHEKEKYLKSFFKSADNDLIEKNSRMFSRECWYPWQYNEIVGFLQIVLNKAKLEGVLWFNVKRISKNNKRKRILLKGKVFECLLNINNSENELIEIVSDKIFDWFNNSPTMKNRYIDVMDTNFKIFSINWMQTISICLQ